MSKTVILGTAHGSNVAGKQSPDGRLREYAYSREVCNLIKAALTAKGVECYIDITTPLESSLTSRVNVVEGIVKQHGGKSNCIYVSIHNNAAGSDGKWHNASGECIYCYDKGSAESKSLAKTFHDTAQELGLGGNRSYPATGYYTANFYVLRATSCPAVLTENLFMDNKDEVDFLLSNEGKQTIVDLHVTAICRHLGVG